MNPIPALRTVTGNNSLKDGRFLLKGELGRGSMGIVYRAHDHDRNILVALKVLKHLDANNIYHFKQEFRSLQHIVHPNLCGLGELIEDEGQWFFIMDLIEGVDFLTYASILENNHMGVLRAENSSKKKSGWNGFSESRLRLALSGLVQGTDALHRAGKIHRDIKPSNVLVTEEGRAVLLDFGLMIEAEDAQETMRGIVGTPEYMAPEQADVQNVVPASDWYSVGIVLYEAITGKLPFQGNPVKILLSKLTETPPPPSAHCPFVPVDLEELCMDLLQADPTKRPTGNEILERLKVGSHPEKQTWDLSVIPEYTGQIAPFVGRREELEILKRAFRDTVKGRAVNVVVEGVSGVGKSALVRAFTQSLYATRSDLVVLTGRCYEQESVPYKAFDGIVDDLARYLRHQPDTAVVDLVPRHVSLLARLFPMLNRIDVIARAVQRDFEFVDPHEIRRIAFCALRDIFELLSQKKRLIVAIDDMQWTDSDSILLLRELLREGAAPPILLILSSRYVEGAERSVLDWESMIPGEIRRISLGALDPESSEAIARLCLENTGLSAIKSVSPADIASEAGGHPLYIAELAHYCAKEGKKEQGQYTLDEVILQRVGQLTSSAQWLLELACVAGNPLQGNHLRELSGIEEEEFVQCLIVLRAGKFLRSRGTGTNAPIEPYHDRVREAVVSSLIKRERANKLHLRIGRFLNESYSADEIMENVFEVVRHLNQAGSLLDNTGERQRLLDLNIDAGNKALTGAAYASATNYFEKAISLMDENRWQNQYERSLELHSRFAEAGFLLRDQDVMNEHCREVIENSRDLLSKVNAYEIMIQDAQSRSNLKYAVAVALDILSQLGFKLPKKISKALIIWEFVKTKILLLKYPVEKNLAAPQMSDPYKVAAVQISYRASHCMFFAFKELMVVNSLKRLRLCLRHGKTSFSPATFIGYGLICCGVLRKFDEGYKYGNLALSLVEKDNIDNARGAIGFRFNGFVRHWKEPLSNALEALTHAYHDCVNVGDFDIASYSASLYCMYATLTGQSMQHYLSSIDEYIKEQNKLVQKFGLRITLSIRQFAENLATKEADHASLKGSYFDEEQQLPLYKEDSDRTGLLVIFVVKTILAYLFGYFDDAIYYAKRYKKFLDGGTSMYLESLFYFYDSLVWTAIWDKLDKKEKRVVRKKIENNLKLLRKFAASCAENYRHKLLLVLAEQARVKGKKNAAIRLYQESVDVAVENGYFNEAAMACELAAKYFLSQSEDRRGKSYIEQSIEHYTSWGAFAKVHQLKSLYSDLLE